MCVFIFRPKKVKNNKYTRAVNEVITPKGYLTDVSINFFIEIVNKKYNGTFEMLDVLLYQTPEFYKDFARSTKDDVQILYMGPVNDVEAVGHYVCIFYKHAEQKVYVYDSKALGSLTDTQHQIVRDLYPSSKSIEFVEPKTKQPDDESCGVFSIAYATALILGEDPKTRSFALDKKSKDSSMSLREHVKKMFVFKDLIKFPA